MTKRHRYTMKRRILVSSLLAALLLVSGAAVQARLQTVEETRAVGAAGFTSASVGSVTLNGTLGQPFVGVSSSGNVDLSHGFWHGVVDNTIYLPVIKR